MTANSVMTVAQFANGTAARIALGKGVIHNRPSTHHRITGTQIQCSASLVGLRWLDPYSSSHCSAVRMAKPYALIEGNSNGPLGSADPARGAPELKLIQVALLLRLHLIELVSRVAGGVALNAGSRHKIRSAEKLLAVFVDDLEIEISGLRQSPSVGGRELAGTRSGFWVRGLAGAAGPQNRRQQQQCTHAEYPSG